MLAVDGGVTSCAHTHQARWYVGVIAPVLLALVGCGDGQSAAARADETILLTGVVQPTPDGPARSVLLRLSGDLWSEAAMPPLMRSGIVGLVYADADTAFAWTLSEGGGSVLRSVDDGRSFELVPDFMPASGPSPPPAVCDLLFVSPSEAWLVTQVHFSLSLPVANGLVFRTEDAGRSWQATALADLDEAPATSGACDDPWNAVALRAREGYVELVRNPQRTLENPRPTRVHVLPDPHGAWVRPASEEFYATAWASFGSRGWIAGFFEPNEGAPKRAGRLAILSATGDSTWEAQTLPECPRCFLGDVEFTSERDGVACGHRSAATACDRQPLCFVTRDGGSTWSASRMPDGVHGLRIAELVRSSDDSRALATADDQDCPFEPGVGSALLQSVDGGASWEMVALPVEGHFRATAMVRAVGK